ncbi:hypothetical protein Tco_1562908 [Tanacetum coccineum]
MHALLFLTVIRVSADPFKVKTGERTLAEGEVSLLTETAYMVVVPSAQTIHLVNDTIVNELEDHAGKKKRKHVLTTAGKSSAVIQRLIDQGKQLDVGSGFAASRAKEFVSSSVTPTLDHGGHEDSGSTHDGNSSSPNPHVRLEVKNVTTEPVDGAVGVSVPMNVVGTSSVPGDETRGFFFRARQWAFLRNRNDADFLGLVNASSAQHICMMSELLLRYEHEITLGKAESEAAAAAGLRKQVSNLEAAAAARLDEVGNLIAQNDELSAMFYGHELDVAAKRFDERSTELDARIAELNYDMDAELYPHMLAAVAGRRWVIGHGLRLAVMKCAQSTKCRAALGKVISLAIDKGIQEGLVAGIEHGKVGRSLSEVVAYDSGVEAAYVAAVNEFENMPFPLLEQLEVLKDSSLELLMSDITFEGDHDDKEPTPKFSASRARCEQHKKARLEVGSPSQPYREGSLAVVDPLASSAANVNYTVPLHDDMVDATILDKPSDS